MLVGLLYVDRVSHMSRLQDTTLRIAGGTVAALFPVYGIRRSTLSLFEVVGCAGSVI